MEAVVTGWEGGKHHVPGQRGSPSRPTESHGILGGRQAPLHLDRDSCVERPVQVALPRHSVSR